MESASEFAISSVSPIPITKRRTRLELQAWEHVRELMPRKAETRGIQYEALEFLFREHLYERVSEETLRDYLLRAKKGKLQPNGPGDFVKSAINMAIKELQRLREPDFELLKIQEPTVEGVKRYVQLEFSKVDSVISHEKYKNYLEDLIQSQAEVIIRQVAFFPHYVTSADFPTDYEAFFRKNRSYSIISRWELVDLKNPNATYFFVPESHIAQNFLMFYEYENSELPALAFLSNFSTTSRMEDAQYIVWRGEDKRNKLKYLHQTWLQMCQHALTQAEMEALRNQVKQMFSTLEGPPELNEYVVLQGLMSQKTQEKIAAHHQTALQSRPI